MHVSIIKYKRNIHLMVVPKKKVVVQSRAVTKLPDVRKLHACHDDIITFDGVTAVSSNPFVVLLSCCEAANAPERTCRVKHHQVVFTTQRLVRVHTQL